MPTVFQLLPDATMLRELEPEELAGALMEHLNSLPANEKRACILVICSRPSGGPASSGQARRCGRVPRRKPAAPRRSQNSWR
jgi:hypothetical protein